MHAAHGAPELLVAKDVTPQCLINGGVLLIRNTAWARALFAELWEGAAAKGVPLYRHFADLVGQEAQTADLTVSAAHCCCCQEPYALTLAWDWTFRRATRS